MIALVGLVVLIAAVVAGVAAVTGNIGQSHLLTTDFNIFNQHYTGSAGEVFAAGIVVGAVGAIGVALLLAGSLTTTRRHWATRRELRRSRREVNATRRDLDRAAPGKTRTATSRRAQPQA